MKTRIIAIASVLGGAAVLTTGGVLIANSLGASPTSDSAFTAVELADIQIIQQAARTYDVSFALPDELANDSSTMAVGLTKLDEYNDDAIALDATIDSGRVLVDGLELDAGDHFLWVEVAGEPVSTPITIPDMTPHVWLDGATPNIEFGQEGRSSWSSYVDPEGKNVFRSASAAFDDSAQPIAENLPITETSFRDNAFTSDEPYYFLVFTGKDGNATFVSSSLFTTATQGDVAVDFVTEGDEPFVVITGSIYASSDATDRRLELRVGNFDSADPTSTFMVENSVSDDATTAFRFVVPAQQLEPGTNNLALFVHEDGSMLEWSIRAPSVDMSRTLQVGQTVFGVTNADALQLTRADLAYQSLRLSLRESNGEALLSVTGTFTPAFSDAGTTLIIKDSEGESYTATDRNASGSGFSFSFALERLGKAGIWYDIDFVNPDSGAVSPIMTRAVSDMRQWLEVDGRTYALADFQGTTKVFFERFPFENASVEFRTISGVPTLVAQGSLVDVRTNDAFMRVRTGDTIAGDVRNISTRPGEFLFHFPLANLGQPGVWYDVVFGDRSTQSLRDFTTSAVSDMSSTLVAGQRTYGYREWNGQLKIAYERSVGSIDLTAGEFIEVGGVATLRLTGTMTGLAQDDAFLRVRTAGESFDFANVAPTAGDVQFDVTLSNLTNANTWYDLVVGNVPENSLTDVLPSIVNMAQTLTSGNRTYDFREFNNQLKVNFAPAAAGSVSIASAQIVDVAGVPTLRVEGSVTGLSQSDVFLRVRTGAQTVDAANSAGAAGDALFVVDLSTLTEANTWYDLVVGVTSTGSLTDLSTSVANMSTSLTLGSRTYEFREFNNQLKVDFAPATAGSVSIDSAQIVDVAGVPTLRVEGSVTGLSQSDVFLRVRTGAQTVDAANSAAAAGDALFVVDLSTLTQADTWYDLVVGVTSTGSLTDLTTAVANMSTSLTLGSRTYEFREWASNLKVNFAPAAAGSVSVSSAEIVDVAGVPTLRVEGSVTGLSQSDVFLRVRTGAQTVDAANSAASVGNALFVVDLSTLTEANTWYDLVVGVTSTGSLTDLTTSVANMSSSLTLGSRTYEFREWASNLKVNFSPAAAGSVSIASAQIVDVAGVPTLRVEGSVTGLSQSDVFLRVRTGAQTVDAANSAASVGNALFVVDLSTLTEANTWYDLVVGVTSTGSLTDLTAVVVGGSLPGDVQIGSNNYGFREWASNLKVNRSPV